MSTKHKVDLQDPHYQEGRRMALEMKLDHILAEARTAAVERKCPRSVEDAPQGFKRNTGRGKPRGRQGGRRHASTTVTPPIFVECSVSSSVEIPLTVPSAKLNPEEQLEKNMDRLSDFLTSYPSAEPQRSSTDSWSFRQQKASERWKEPRPYNLKCLIEKEAVGHPLCCLCHEPAVIRCKECLPVEWFCGDCDVLHHKQQPLHNRECVFMDFWKPFLQPHMLSKVKIDIESMSKLAYCHM